MTRALTAYEAKIFQFMDQDEYTRGHVRALAAAVTDADREDIIARAVDRYEDWASDNDI